MKLQIASVNLITETEAKSTVDKSYFHFSGKHVKHFNVSLILALHHTLGDLDCFIGSSILLTD